MENSVSVLIDATTSGAAEVFASAIVAIIAATSWESARLVWHRAEADLLDDGSALILTVAN